MEHKPIYTNCTYDTKRRQEYCGTIRKCGNQTSNYHNVTSLHTNFRIISDSKDHNDTENCLFQSAQILGIPFLKNTSTYINAYRQRCFCQRTVDGNGTYKTHECACYFAPKLWSEMNTSVCNDVYRKICDIHNATKDNGSGQDVFCSSRNDTAGPFEFEKQINCSEFETTTPNPSSARIRTTTLPITIKPTTVVASTALTDQGTSSVPTTAPLPTTSDDATNITTLAVQLGTTANNSTSHNSPQIQQTTNFSLPTADNTTNTSATFQNDSPSTSEETPSVSTHQNVSVDAVSSNSTKNTTQQPTVLSPTPLVMTKLSISTSRIGDTTNATHNNAESTAFGLNDTSSNSHNNSEPITVSSSQLTTETTNTSSGTPVALAVQSQQNVSNTTVNSAQSISNGSVSTDATTKKNNSPTTNPKTTPETPTTVAPSMISSSNQSTSNNTASAQSTLRRQSSSSTPIQSTPSSKSGMTQQANVTSAFPSSPMPLSKTVGTTTGNNSHRISPKSATTTSITSKKTSSSRITTANVQNSLLTTVDTNNTALENSSLGALYTTPNDTLTSITQNGSDVPVLLPQVGGVQFSSLMSSKTDNSVSGTTTKTALVFLPLLVMFGLIFALYRRRSKVKKQQNRMYRSQSSMGSFVSESTCQNDDDHRPIFAGGSCNHKQQANLNGAAGKPGPLKRLYLGLKRNNQQGKGDGHNNPPSEPYSVTEFYFEPSAESSDLNEMIDSSNNAGYDEILHANPLSPFDKTKELDMQDDADSQNLLSNNKLSTENLIDLNESIENGKGFVNKAFDPFGSVATIAGVDSAGDLEDGKKRKVLRINCNTIPTHNFRYIDELHGCDEPHQGNCTHPHSNDSDEDPNYAIEFVRSTKCDELIHPIWEKQESVYESTKSKEKQHSFDFPLFDNNSKRTSGENQKTNEQNNNDPFSAEQPEQNPESQDRDRTPISENFIGTGGKNILLNF